MRAIVAAKIRDYCDEVIPEVFERDLSLGDIRPPARGNELL